MSDGNQRKFLRASYRRSSTNVCLAFPNSTNIPLLQYSDLLPKMPDKDASTPRVFLIRHGETEWSQTGRHTGKTEIPLTAHGEEQVKALGKVVYGSGKLIDPAKVMKVYVSPRQRATRTWELLSDGNEGYEVANDLAEWDYGCDARSIHDNSTVH